jgi:S-adenosylmethionine-diacylgycerolhomoserine-N-methlytransferase
MINDLKTIFHLVTSPVRGDSHEERMSSFYEKQAEHYDRFRERLLKGRRELFERLPANPGNVLVDMGGGTGANLEFLGERVRDFSKIYIVDISEPLLEVARQRIRERKWKHVEAVAASAADFSPPSRADIVTFSYSLSMMPNWFTAIDRAHDFLKPGGVIGTVDFYVSPKFAASERVQHNWWTRTFWPTWFARDNVHLKPEQLEYLHYKFTMQSLHENAAYLPYVPPVLGKVPYYQFIGRKGAASA